MKYAVIFTTTENAYEFRPTQGLYKKNCEDLEKAGYTLLSVNVENQESIEKQLASLPDGSIGFLWNRMHGHPKKMRAAKSFDITSSNLQDIFRDLPKKLSSNATIYLDACHTTSLKEDFYNNIQFTFAKLTVDMPNVQIAAPAEASHIAWFSMMPNGTFSFDMLADPGAIRSMAITLGADTKAILQTAVKQNTPLDSIKKELLHKYALIKKIFRICQRRLPRYKQVLPIFCLKLPQHFLHAQHRQHRIHFQTLASP